MKPRRTISPERKALHTAGVIVQVVGGIVVVVGFVGFVLGGQRAVSSFGSEGSPLTGFFAFGAGVLLVAGGAVMRTIAARGVAGSGVVLDPERARQDLEPWARTGGGLLEDALDEAGLIEERPGRRDDPIVRVRCRECRELNDEDARFCDACGAKL